MPNRLSSDDESEDESVYDVRGAHERLVTAGDRDQIYDVSKSYQAGKEEFRRSESEDSVAST